MGEPQEVVADPVWPERRWIGWQDAEWDEETKRDPVRGWWRIGTEYRQPGTAMVVLVGRPSSPSSTSVAMTLLKECQEGLPG